jgi:hypothetical protein
MSNSENLFFSLEELNNNSNIDSNIDLSKLTDEINKIDNISINKYNNDTIYFIELTAYNGEMELYYNDKYTIKELMKICNYYGILKNIKAAKCKKQDIIETIIYFENCVENYDIVRKRHKMWSYITELLNDLNMKQYILWY